ncbi:MAG: DUF47 domain-containing protein [Anaerovoracaceae bacterium]|jgi:uncharacterized protein Yka (UPF0111/DUF47 family)
MERKIKNFFSKDERPNFDVILGKQCENALQASELLLRFMKNPEDKSLADEIEKVEKAADQNRNEIVYYVQNSFITPVDRHDIFGVSRLLDDITDEIKDLKDFILFFSYVPTPKNIEMASHSHDSICILEGAVREWNKNDADLFWQHVLQTKKNGYQVKRLYWENIREIEEHGLEGVGIINREISHDLYSLAKKINRAADRIGDLKIKSIR